MFMYLWLCSGRTSSWIIFFSGLGAMMKYQVAYELSVAESE